MIIVLYIVLIFICFAVIPEFARFLFRSIERRFANRFAARHGLAREWAEFYVKDCHRFSNSLIGILSAAISSSGLFIPLSERAFEGGSDHLVIFWLLLIGPLVPLLVILFRWLPPPKYEAMTGKKEFLLLNGVPTLKAGGTHLKPTHARYSMPYVTIGPEGSYGETILVIYDETGPLAKNIYVPGESAEPDIRQLQGMIPVEDVPVNKLYLEQNLQDARRSWEEAKTTYGMAHIETMEKGIKLAGLLKEAGSFEEAENLYGKALSTYDELFKSDGIGKWEKLDLSHVFQEYGEALEAQGKMKEAELAYRRSIEILKEEGFYQNLGVKNIIEKLAGVLREQGHTQEAETVYSEWKEAHAKYLEGKEG